MAADQRQLYRQEQERRRQRAAAWRDRILGAEATESALAVLPANRRRIGPLPAERRRAFLDHLAECANEALSSPAPPRRTHDATTADAGSSAPLLSLGCATCRGQCCGSGGTHAYLGADEMRDYLAAHPDEDVDDLLRAYAAHLPESSYAGSCVFHGRDGCTLPRQMRGRVCNSFLCSALVDLRAQVDAGARTVFAVAADGAGMVRGAVFDDGGIRRQLAAPRRSLPKPRD